MYQEYYGFNEKPFAITPNPRFLFLSKIHKEVFAHLLYGIDQRSGFIELIGEVGAGKTTVLRTLMTQLADDAYRLALIFNPSLSATDLLRSILREFGQFMDGASPAELLERLNEFLLQENAAGRTVVLVIDEAQNLQPSVLEQIRLLSNLETETTKLIQIVLVGQPELGHLLERPDLRQLSQRITVRFHLQPMDFDDTVAYIQHRLRIAGCQEKSLFTPAAIRKIYRFSGGLPRLINVLCDRALLVGYAEEAKGIAPAQVAVAQRELRREASRDSRWWRQRSILVLVPLFLAAALAGWLAGRNPQLPMASPVSMTAATAPPAVEPAAAVPDIAALRRRLAEMPETESALNAFNALLEFWHLPLTAEKVGRAGLDFLRPSIQALQLQMTPVNGNLQLLRNLHSPAILSLSLPEATGPRYLALIRIDDDVIVAAPSPGESAVFSWTELQSLWFGRSFLLWKNHLDIPSLTEQGASGAGVVRLQELLREVGAYAGPDSGIYDAATIESVRRFQGSHGIVQDGHVGPQTLILLYQRLRRFAQPHADNRDGENT